ncbi:MAG: hypothetical protein GF383_12555 [Candidatus Lokiarchaeota archaeon]|nr:hypothetical protein [Candidatus Lokiarchaeota archaeon]MBD3341856.1 hypothetical protein [Candidatus Lokiarchaeota archaeon]
MDKKKYYKYLFIVGAFFNWINASSFLFLSIIDKNIFKLFGSSFPPTLFFLHSLLALIAVYGLGYFIVGLNLDKNKGVVILGIVSKLSFFTCCVVYYLIGDLTLIIVILGSGDFIFACLFIEFYLNYK